MARRTVVADDLAQLPGAESEVSVESMARVET
jgi:hypothetical protein